jgi:glycosyltransferase involved in cell wall biosynthesis
MRKTNKKNASKPKILMVANYRANIGGISALVENLSWGLIKEGYKVNIHSITGSIIRRIWAYIRLFFKIWKFEIIHAHGSSYFGFLPVFVSTIASSLFRKPIIVTYHGSVVNAISFIRRSFLVRYVTRKAVLIITPIEETALCFRQFEIKSAAIPNIFNSSMWAYRQRKVIKPKLIWTRNTYKPELAVEAFKIVKEKHPEATLVMCGKSATRNYLSKYKDTDGLSLKSFVPRKDLSLILDECDVYLNTIGEDSFGYSIFEAVSAGLICVSVPSPALEEYLDDAIYFSDSMDHKDVANQIIYALENQKETLEKIAIGKNKVREFSVNRIIPIWENLYK